MDKIGCLQWVDDNLLAATNGYDLQKALDITNTTSNEYHVEYGQPKSNTQLIKSKKKEEEHRGIQTRRHVTRNDRQVQVPRIFTKLKK